MRIIEEGRLPDQTLTGRCIHCQCKVECDRGEAEYVAGDRPGETGGWTVQCPTMQCGRAIWLKPKDRWEGEVGAG